jgi:hypothetical protein
MSLQIVQAGLLQYKNEDILLLGGYSRSGSTPPGTVGAGFAAFDARRLAAGETSQSAKLGDVEVFLLQPQLQLFHGLVNIEVQPNLRLRGIGRRIISSIAATAPDCLLMIYDIQESAVPFWIRIGCTFHPRPPAWDAHFRLQSGRAKGTGAPPPGEVRSIPASRLRPGDRSPD